MSPSFDCIAATSLLCSEDNNSLLCLDESDVWYQETNLNYNQNRTFVDGNGGSCLMGFSSHSEESVSLMVENESHHLPRYDYLGRLQSGELDSSMRRDAVEWIFKVHAHYNFGPLTAYLSINYLDRFLSAYQLPKGKAWMMQLLAVSCLSIAAKMEETDVPLSLDLQVCEAKFVFEARTIQRMELLVLSTLKWRMQSVTSFSFIDYFLSKFNNDQPPQRYLISRSVDIILRLLQGIDYLKFRPSEVAVAVAISVLGETQTVDMDHAAPHFIQLVQKERVLKCIEMIQEISFYSGSVKVSNSAPLSSVPQSPIGVLDAAACLSYKSDEQTVGSCANSSHSSPEANKRRKLNHYEKI